MATGIALATDRFYGDTSGKSRSGEYTAEAKSPANKDGNLKHPFQEDFTITFKNTKSGKTLWAWHQQKDDASPVDLILTDDGYLVMQDAVDQYRVFGTNGVSSKPVSAFASIPKKEQERFTDWTTAGVMWQQYSRKGFYTHDETTLFYLRTYWGHIFAISLPDGKATKKKDVLTGIEAQVVQETRAWIKGFDSEFFFKCPDCGGNHVKPEITEGLFIIKKHKIPEGKAITEKALKKMDDSRNSDLKGYLDRL
jgi:hypothetical protein